MSAVMTTREAILDEAKRLTTVNRQTMYGPPEDSFGVTASFWSTYLTRLLGVKVELLPVDVARLMGLLKIGRMFAAPGNADNYVDLAGYAVQAAPKLYEALRVMLDHNCDRTTAEDECGCFDRPRPSHDLAWVAIRSAEGKGEKE